MSYIPPHLRKASIPKDPPPKPLDPGLEQYAIRDIQHHYWRRDENDGTSMPQHSTLNDSFDRQGQLTHVLLFQGANPRWGADRIIFVKSNLEILPQYHEAKASRASRGTTAGDETASTITGDKVETIEETEERTETEDATETEGENGSLDNLAKPTAFDNPSINISPQGRKPIACFTQAPRAHRNEGFTFAGYYTISHIALLAPRSKELTRMLEQKWSNEDKRGNAHFAKRSQKGWEESLSHEWAVIQFETTEGEEVPEPPTIEKLPKEEWKPRGKERETRSVNELLAEMRMK